MPIILKRAVNWHPQLARRMWHQFLIEGWWFISLAVHLHRNKFKDLRFKCAVKKYGYPVSSKNWQVVFSAINLAWLSDPGWLSSLRAFQLLSALYLHVCLVQLLSRFTRCVKISPFTWRLGRFWVKRPTKRADAQSVSKATATHTNKRLLRKSRSTLTSQTDWLLTYIWVWIYFKTFIQARSWFDICYW